MPGRGNAWRSRHPPQLAAQVQGVRYALGRHEQLVREAVTLHPIGTRERRHLEPRPCPADDSVAIRRELHRRTIDVAVSDLGQSDRMGETQLELASGGSE